MCCMVVVLTCRCSSLHGSKPAFASSMLNGTSLYQLKVSWETTEQHTVAWEFMEELLKQAEVSCSSLGTFLRGITRPFLREKDRWRGALICDAVAMAVAIDPEVVMSVTECFVDVELHGRYGRGQTVIDWEGQLKGKTEVGAANVKIVEKINMDRMHEMLLGIVKTATALAKDPSNVKELVQEKTEK